MSKKQGPENGKSGVGQKNYGVKKHCGLKGYVEILVGFELLLPLNKVFRAYKKAGG